MPAISHSSVEVRLAGRCALACTTCDCHAPGLDEPRLERAIAGGGERLTLRNVDGAPNFARLVALARRSGFAEVVARTSGVGLTTGNDAERLRALGVQRVLVPFFSHRTRSHDRLAGREGALARALVGIRAAASGGLAVSAEIPLLGESVQDLVELVSLLRRAVPGLASVQLQATNVLLPPALAARPWSEEGPRLARALDHCFEHGIAVTLGEREGIPLCALSSREELAERVFRFSPRGKSRPPGPDACTGCNVRRQCPGVSPAYRALHGDSGLAPYARRPKRLFLAQRTTPARKWTEEARASSRVVGLRVLRPTVNCNQDCVFCSANETSGNVWEDPERMLRAIARSARTGIYQLSFGGGEPTLSRHLVDFVATASRLGIRDVEIVTNAVLLAREEKVRALKAAGLTRAFVSLHAHDEELSRRITLKTGDFEKSLRGIHNLLDAGVRVRVNHVISALNYRHLERFVEFMHREFGGVSVSFAFVTPQYRALQNVELVPRISEVMPYLARAMYRALELGVTFVVGSRQGIPPCFLKEFAAWSDVFVNAAEAGSEDAHQKEKAAACISCRFSEVCTGLWKPYTARYGLGELEPAPGEKLKVPPFLTLEGFLELPSRFAEAPPALRAPEREALGLEGWPLPESTESKVSVGRSRPVRALLIGTGTRAHILFQAAQGLDGFTFDSVASPHARALDGRRFGYRPAYASAAEALQDQRPECAVIASATLAHVSLARTAIEASVPVLIEKPVGGTSSEVRALHAFAEERGILALPAHQVLHAPGLERLLEAAPHAVARVERRVRAGSPDLPLLWSRKALFECLYHLVVLVEALAVSAPSRVEVESVTSSARPERLRFLLDYERTRAELVVEGNAATDELVLSAGRFVWSRAGGRVALTERGHAIELSRSRGETAQMLHEFAELALAPGRPPRTKLLDAARAIDTTNALIEALDHHGVAFARPEAPRHASSRDVRPSYS